MLLQGVCDHNLLFTNVYAGEPGSIHDNTLFKKSDLFAAIQRKEILFYEDHHLIGDLAYKLSTNLLVGFKNIGPLTQSQKNFNMALSKARVRIEHAYALLKGRFRRLKLIENLRLDVISLIIIASCVLHNVCILNGESANDVDMDADSDSDSEVENNKDLEEELTNAAAIQKRNNIVTEL